MPYASRCTSPASRPRTVRRMARDASYGRGKITDVAAIHTPHPFVFPSRQSFRRSIKVFMNFESAASFTAHVALLFRLPQSTGVSSTYRRGESEDGCSSRFADQGCLPLTEQKWGLSSRNSRPAWSTLRIRGFSREGREPEGNLMESCYGRVEAAVAKVPTRIERRINRDGGPCGSRTRHAAGCSARTEPAAS